MGKTDRDILGEATGIDGQLRRRNVNSQNDGRGILLIQNPADQTLVRADLCRQMPGVGFVLRTGLTRVIFPHRVGMMMKRRDKQHRQENRQHQEGGYALFQRHNVQSSECKDNKNPYPCRYGEG